MISISDFPQIPDFLPHRAWSSRFVFFHKICIALSAKRPKTSFCEKKMQTIYALGVSCFPGASTTLLEFIKYTIYGVLYCVVYDDLPNRAFDKLTSWQVLFQILVKNSVVPLEPTVLTVQYVDKLRTRMKSSLFIYLFYVLCNNFSK